MENFGHVTGAACQSHGPVFLLEPPSHLTFSNTSGSQVSCSAHGSPSPQVDWLLQDGQTVAAVPGLRYIYYFIILRYILNHLFLLDSILSDVYPPTPTASIVNGAFIICAPYDNLITFMQVTLLCKPFIYRSIHSTFELFKLSIFQLREKCFLAKKFGFSISAPIPTKYLCYTEIIANTDEFKFDF